MAEPFLGEIRIFSFGYAPAGWALCNGAVLNISQNAALYSLLGTTFGGDGKITFQLPDLRGRVPRQANVAINVNVGSQGGAETVTLTSANWGPHTHSFMVTTTVANEKSVPGTVYAQIAPETSQTTQPNLYGPLVGSPIPLDPTSVQSAGGGLPHPNMQPFLVLNFCIAMQGNYPPRS